jgi:Protein of unknown function, DUF481
MTAVLAIIGLLAVPGGSPAPEPRAGSFAEMMVVDPVIRGIKPLSSTPLFLDAAMPKRGDEPSTFAGLYDLSGLSGIPAGFSAGSGGTSFTTPGLTKNPGRWLYKGTADGGLFRLTTKIEHPDPNDLETLPYGARDWKAEEKVQVPLPLDTPVAQQVYLFGQVSGNGDSFNNRQTTLNGKTGFGLKWSVFGDSELQLRYGTMFTYADVYSNSRFQERARPAVEILAKTPLIGPLSVEYTGSALPALSANQPDQLQQELRFAVPFRGDNEFEIGARYRWETVPTLSATTPLPWYDRAQLFIGLKFRH